MALPVQHLPSLPPVLGCLRRRAGQAMGLESRGLRDQSPNFSRIEKPFARHVLEMLLPHPRSLAGHGEADTFPSSSKHKHASNPSHHSPLPPSPVRSQEHREHPKHLPGIQTSCSTNSPRTQFCPRGLQFGISKRLLKLISSRSSANPPTPTRLPLTADNLDGTVCRGSGGPPASPPGPPGISGKTPCERETGSKKLLAEADLTTRVAGQIFTKPRL